jgi:hypothetical protein
MRSPSIVPKMPAYQGHRETLDALLEHGTWMTAAELSELKGWRMSSTSVRLSRLYLYGRIERTTLPDDPHPRHYRYRIRQPEHDFENTCDAQHTPDQVARGPAAELPTPPANNH